MVLRPHRSRHRPNKTVPPGHDGSDFFSSIFIPSLVCLLTDLLFATWLLAYPYLPAPRPDFLDTEDGEGMIAIRMTWAAILLASCGDGRRWMATVAEWLRCRDCLISGVRCHPSHEMIGRLNCDVGGCPLSFFARPPLPCSSRFACLNCSPAPGRREEPADVGLRLRA